MSGSRSSELTGVASTAPARLRIVVVGFDHMHAGDQIAVVQSHESTALVGVWDSARDGARMSAVCDDLDVAAELRFEALDALVEQARPDIAVICSPTSDHLRHVEYFAARGVHLLVEKPFAANLADARAMTELAQSAGVLLGVNWPLAWFPVHRTAHRLIAAGAIGSVVEVHYYDGNRGPLFHGHAKHELDGSADPAIKATSWWYSAAQGGGSLRDYLGYGTTLATWFRGGEMPIDVTARVHHADGDEVDEQSVVIASYASGLSTFQTRWGTFTDPWTHQPAPRCGFVVVGTEGTLISYDYADHVVLQTRQHPGGVAVPVDTLPLHETGGVANLVHALGSGGELTGPISSQVSLAGQRITEAAQTSARSRRPVPLADVQ